MTWWRRKSAAIETSGVQYPARFPGDIYSLERKVTALKKSGDMDGAISLLRVLKEKYRLDSDEHSVSKHLRLPLYLQKAGRWREALIEFEALLDEDAPLSPHIEVRIMEQSTIHDKMRLAYQRQGDNDTAITYGILAKYRAKSRSITN
jgi:tetratricopeptide (TPR) repeat protein